MNYLKEMNETDSGFEVIYCDEDSVEYSNSYDTYGEAIDFIGTLDLTGK